MWEQIKGRVKKAWGELTDDDFKMAEGSLDKLYGVIREKVGDTDEVFSVKLEKIHAEHVQAAEEALRIAENARNIARANLREARDRRHSARQKLAKKSKATRAALRDAKSGTHEASVASPEKAKGDTPDYPDRKSAAKRANRRKAAGTAYAKAHHEGQKVLATSELDTISVAAFASALSDAENAAAQTRPHPEKEA
jgi:uncharacterized protein YjbJ (UPF0337 family)